MAKFLETYKDDPGVFIYVFSYSDIDIGYVIRQKKNTIIVFVKICYI